MDSFLHLGELAVELSRIPAMRRGEVRRRAPYEEGRGLDNYLKAKNSETGVLFVTAHISAWEFLPAAHAAGGYPLSFLVRRLDNPWLDRWSRRIRCKFGNGVLDKRQSIRKVMSLIRGGGDVGFLLDQNVMEREGIYAPFLRPSCRDQLKRGGPGCSEPELLSCWVFCVRGPGPVFSGFVFIPR